MSPETTPAKCCDQCSCKDGWQPIETAPKDRRVRFLACAIDPNGPGDADPYDCIEILSRADQNGYPWFNHNSSNFTKLRVTHWRPLPTPPTT